MAHPFRSAADVVGVLTRQHHLRQKAAGADWLVLAAQKVWRTRPDLVQVQLSKLWSSRGWDR